MGKKEQRAKEVFREEAQGVLNIEWIESISSGMADSICINRKGTSFWIEFKAIHDWPKRKTTLPLRGAFEKGQIPFLKQWRSWRGKSFVCLKAAGEFYLLHPTAHNKLELSEMTTDQIINGATRIGLKEIVNYLSELQ